ncbi:MAG: DUF4174 domain-containing protein [Paracoccaceae bacterium]|jgi:hypothetical protein|nr:DUF4174 domain-containing protein [Paracoccaceae bacterium]
MSLRNFAIPLATLAVMLPMVGLAQSAAPGDGAATGAGAEPTTAERTLEIYDAAGVSLDDFKWTNRPIVVFADSAADPRFAEQMQLLTARPFDLIERDVVVITDTDPDARSDVRQRLRPRGFQVTLIGKDGEVELRKPSPWSSRELSRSIDKMPLRQQEIRERNSGAG